MELEDQRSCPQQKQEGEPQALLGRLSRWPLWAETTLALNRQGRSARRASPPTFALMGSLWMLVSKFARPLGKASFAAYLRPKTNLHVLEALKRFHKKSRPPPWKTLQSSTTDHKPLGKPPKRHHRASSHQRSESTFDVMTTRPGEAKHGPLIAFAIRERSDRTKRERAKRATEPKASQAKRRRRAPKGQPSEARQPNRERSASKRTLLQQIDS